MNLKTQKMTVPKNHEAKTEAAYAALQNSESKVTQIKTHNVDTGDGRTLTALLRSVESLTQKILNNEAK